MDHITPRIKGGRDDISNLQALCYRCNAMKRDRDDTDFRQHLAHLRRTSGFLSQMAFSSCTCSAVRRCPFCSVSDEMILLQNSLAVVVRDQYPVSEWYLLVIPKRHTADYFDLGSAEVRACQTLLAEARNLVLNEDPTVLGFNVGINSGSVAGQTVMHTHIHLIPRGKATTRIRVAVCGA